MIRGISNVFRRLRGLETDAELARRATIDTWSDEMKATAKEFAPVRKDKLRPAIDARVNYSAGRAFVGVWDNKVMQYAYYVEKGTSSMRAQPYLAPAYLIHRRTAVRELRRQVRRRMR